MQTKRNNQGFTLIELMVVITIIAVLASFATPAFTRMQTSAKITKDVNNIRQIILACKSYATDEDGAYPYKPYSEDGSGDGTLSTSADAFNVLLKEGYIDTESIFWFKTTNPAKLSPPKEDGTLESDEVTYCYVRNQLDTSFSRSPLLADEQTGAGVYGEYHPWLNARKAVVGYCGGQVAAEKLDSKDPGAIVKTRDGIEIFQPKGDSDSGDTSGLLSPGLTTSDVLQPGS